MYKIFINDKPFIIANSAFTDNSFPSFDFEEKLFETKITEVFANQFTGVVFKCKDEELVFNKFAKHFKIIEAAGGLVFNSKKQLLLIERLGVWDLPKGKIDVGEIPEIAAVREVEEECAVTGLTIGVASISKGLNVFICDSVYNVLETKYLNELANGSKSKVSVLYFSDWIFIVLPIAGITPTEG
jgi:hypothetical protein